MDLQLFNTLSRKVEVFIPLVPGEVGFYACGPPVYNYTHIGNLRAYIRVLGLGLEDVRRSGIELPDEISRLIAEREKALATPGIGRRPTRYRPGSARWSTPLRIRLTA